MGSRIKSNWIGKRYAPTIAILIGLCIYSADKRSADRFIILFLISNVIQPNNCLVVFTVLLCKCFGCFDYESLENNILLARMIREINEFDDSVEDFIEHPYLKLIGIGWWFFVLFF